MVDVVVAFPATLAALAGAVSLFPRVPPGKRAYGLPWCATLVALALALAAMTAGYAMGFRPALLRATELGGSLAAPLTLAVGVVELVARSVQARFAARLIAISYAIVAVVILLLDPITGEFGKSLPDVGRHYSSLAQLVLDGGHVFAVVTLAACAAVTASRGHDPVTVALVAGAGVLMVVVTRGYLPGPLAPLALGGAAALVWYGAGRVLREKEDDDVVPDRRDTPPRALPEAAAYAPAPNTPAPNTPGPDAPGRYGRITIYTLLEGHAEVFDRLAAEVTRAVSESEPGTIVYACHAVDNTADQRIFYQLFRDAAAVEEHTRQPHVQRFAGAVRAHVAATNVIELTVRTGKVAPPLAVPWRHG
jgi:quinol monooxygenase YgiN